LGLLSALLLAGCGDRLSYGMPQLMMGFTQNGQVKPELLQARGRRFKISTGAKEQDRRDIPTPKVQPGADAWQDGDAVQLASKSAPVRNIRPAQGAR
jgi:Protein of unknown function (DUF1264)